VSTSAGTTALTRSSAIPPLKYSPYLSFLDMRSAILLSFSLFQFSDALGTLDQQSILDVGTTSTSLSRSNAKRVAIIGSGIAGAIAAYTLREESRIYNVNVEISVFEAQSCVGGRIGYTNRMERSPWVLDVGAVSFLEEDWCVNEAIRSTGLRTRLDPLQGSLGVWNGREFTFKQDSDQQPSSWWNLGKMMWRYGMSPWTLQQAVKRDLDKWQNFHLYSTFDDISREFKNVGLTGDILQSADAYLRNLNISESYIIEIVEPKVRFRSNRDLSEVPALDMLLAISQGRRQKVEEGNIRLVERLLLLSRAEIETNTTVEVVSAGTQRRYRLGIKATDSNDHAKYPEYDAVIITAPFQSNGIAFHGISTQRNALRPYVQMHTTNVISKDMLSSSFFNISSSTIPSNILTASAHNSTLGFHGIQYLGRYGHRLKCPNPIGCDMIEYAHHYRIISSEEISNTTIAALTGMPGPDLDKKHVHWIHREAWKYGAPKYDSEYQLFDKVELAPSLLYPSGAEEVASSLEMACRVAKNTAKILVWRRWFDFEL
jgi:prenylcysteine oxidase/farnesylcysteine lyase